MGRPNRTAYAILFLLRLGPMSGYELKKSCERFLSQFWDESFGQLYPQLAQLLEAGAVAKVAEKKETKRGRQRYRITPGGRRMLREWLQAPPLKRSVRDELLLKLSCGTEVPPDVHVRHLQACLRETEEQLEALRLTETETMERFERMPDQPYWLISVRAGIAILEARHAWCKESIDVLKVI